MVWFNIAEILREIGIRSTKVAFYRNNWDQSGNKISHIKFPIFLSFHYNSIMNYNVNTVFKLSFSVQT